MFKVNNPSEKSNIDLNTNKIIISGRPMLQTEIKPTKVLAADSAQRLNPQKASAEPDCEIVFDIY